ncbi:hypothetical protein F5890DRAFT_1559740 [Lentinula detonsa]|uniref:Uncharacterized protein n=1 Tax=Lentinula detonsa TaxID=2804962 RepID=A0AA38PP69_9AGAR|nr:hypothetical protein F5890DRAFT_1559740 [Lentinula detonsa]
MSTTSNDNETIQQRRKRILQAQAARQQAREEEIARQEAEFAAEMERIKAEEKAAREVEEKRKAEERRREEEKRWEEERKKRLEECRIAEERRRAEEAMAEAEDERVCSAAYAKLVEENRVEREKAAKELEKRQKRPVAKAQPVTVVILLRPSGSKKKSFKSKSVISDDSDAEEREATPAPRGEKRKRPIKMIARGGHHSDPDDDFEPEQDGSNPPPPSNDLLQNRPACSQCVSIGRPSECRPQSSRRQAQACVVCHQQRQRCSWSGDNASRRSRGKWVKLDDDVYEGPATRVGERRFEGPGIAEQLAAIVGQNKDLIDIARRSLDVQARIMYLLVRREKRELKVLGGNEGRSEDEDEDEDGEGEEDEEEEEKDNEKRKNEIREGKKRAE